MDFDPESLELDLRLSSPDSMGEQLTFTIYAQVQTATKAFEKVAIRIDANNNRIFIKVTLRWWARFKKFRALHQVWLMRAEERIKEFIPNGWRALVYYEKFNRGSTARGAGSEYQDDSNGDDGSQQ